MGVILTIIRREFTDWWRDGRLRWLAGGCILLLLSVALLGWQSTIAVVDARSAAIEQETENFLNQGAKNPHAAAHFGQYAFRPTLLPAAIDPGVDAWMGKMVWLEAHRRNLAEFRPAEDGASHGQAVTLSVSWVLQYVVPLLLVIMGFAAVAGERDRGTLALLVAQGLRLQTLALGKGLAMSAAIFMLLIPVVAVVIALYALTPTAIDTHDAGARLAWMSLGYLLYIVGFSGVVLCISMLSRSARTALFALLIFWVSVVVLIPRLATDSAAARHPLPAASDFWAAIKRGEGADVVSEIPEERAARLRESVAAELLARYGVGRIEDLPVNFTAVYLQRLEEADAPAFDHAYGKLWAAQENQRISRSIFGVLSPTISLREISMALAGTDPFALWHFGQAAEAHRRILVASLNGAQARDGAGRGFYVAPADTWQQMPRFVYEPPLVTAVISRHAVDFILLILWALIPMLAAWLIARRTRIAA